jgi:adenosine deaminase
VKRVAELPVRSFLDAGVSVSINTDDPVILDTDLVGEYRTFLEHGLISANEIRSINERAMRTVLWGAK